MYFHSKLTCFPVLIGLWVVIGCISPHIYLLRLPHPWQMRTDSRPAMPSLHMMQLMQVPSSPFDKSATYWRPCPSIRILVLHLVDIFVSAMAWSAQRCTSRNARAADLSVSVENLCRSNVSECSRHVCWIAATSPITKKALLNLKHRARNSAMRSPSRTLLLRELRKSPWYIILLVIAPVNISPNFTSICHLATFQARPEIWLLFFFCHAWSVLTILTHYPSTLYKILDFSFCYPLTLNRYIVSFLCQRWPSFILSYSLRHQNPGYLLLEEAIV